MLVVDLGFYAFAKIKNPTSLRRKAEAMSGFVAGGRASVDTTTTDVLSQMSDAIAHRGIQRDTLMFPGGFGVITRYRDNCGFQVSCHTSEEFGIVLDGLIFNKDTLGRELGVDQSAGTAGIVLKGYEKYGDSWFARLDGSFALVVFNLVNGKTILVRDRFGHRPLYFALVNGCMWCASEIKALLNAPKFQPSVNRDVLDAAIGYGVTPGPQTLFKNIFKVVPGIVFSIEDGERFDVSPYFRPTAQIRKDLDFENVKEYVFEGLGQNVERYVDACPEVGTFLSGGVDSALLGFFLSRAPGASPLAVSFGASSWKDDESGEANEIANSLGMRFNRTYVSPQDDFLQSIENAIWQLEEPSRFENAIALEMTCRDNSNSCSALMTGEGADAMLGEHQHHFAKRLSQLLLIPKFVRAPIRSIGPNRWRKLGMDAFARYLRFDSIEDYIKESFANCTNLAPGSDGPAAIEYGKMITECVDLPPAAHFIYVKLLEFSHCWVERMEKIASGSGLECFHPFQRNWLLQLGMELPDQLRVDGGFSKPVLRSLAADQFGKTMAYRSKKQLAAPMALWLDRSDQLRSAVLKLKSPNTRLREYVNNDVLNMYLNTYEDQGISNNQLSRSLFRMLSFEIWLKKFM
jgi:asparagine synthase (glutamine-hydrolysing)